MTRIFYPITRMFIDGVEQKGVDWIEDSVHVSKTKAPPVINLSWVYIGDPTVHKAVCWNLTTDKEANRIIFDSSDHQYVFECERTTLP